MRGQSKLILVMLIFGSIGLFVKNIDLSSSEIALLRGIIGSVFLLGVSLLVKTKVSWEALKGNRLLLILSGATLGFNWIFLFESYRYTTISNATISYYFAPVFVMVLAPFILKEKLTAKKVGCIVAAMAGLFLVVFNGEGVTANTSDHAVGILYGLLAASLYAGVILMNKFITNLSGYETTFIQLIVASIVMLPYVTIQEGLNFSGITGQSLLLILIVGIIHTGLAYYLYFAAIKELKGETIALLSYIDPIFAVGLSVLFLKEGMSISQAIGGLLVLCSAYYGGKKKQAES